VIAGYVVMAAVAIGLGLIITKWLAGGPVSTSEDSVNRWFVEQRTTTLDSVSRAGSDFGCNPDDDGVPGLPRSSAERNHSDAPCIRLA
jgi:hypothetical protein